MKDLLRSIYSNIENTDGVLLPDEFSAMKILQISLKEMISTIDDEIREEEIRRKEADKAGVVIKLYSTKFMSDLKNLCETIYISSNYYINATYYFENERRKSFFGKIMSEDKEYKAIKSKRKHRIHIIQPHEIRYFEKGNITNNLKNKIKSIKSYLDQEKIYQKLSSIEENFSKNLLIFMTVLFKRSES